jgi:hypothetical protein
MLSRTASFIVLALAIILVRLRQKLRWHICALSG